MPSETFFSKICWQNPVKTSFMYRQRTATAAVFLNKVVTIDSLILFSKHISRLAILTQASYLLQSLEFFLYWFYMFNPYNFSFQRLIRKMIPTPIPRIPTLIPRIPFIPLILFPNLVL